MGKESANQLNYMQNAVNLGGLLGVDKANEIIVSAINTTASNQEAIANEIIEIACSCFGVNKTYLLSNVSDGVRIHLVGICWNLLCKHTILSSCKKRELLGNAVNRHFARYGKELNELNPKIPDHYKIIQVNAIITAKVEEAMKTTQK